MCIDHLPAPAPVQRRELLRWICHGLPLLALPAGALVPAGCSKVEGTGRTQFAIIPHSQMVSLSDQAFAEMSQSEKVCTHQPTVAMVQRLGERLNKHAGSAQVQYRFSVFENNQTANAFAMPNGQVVIYTGILKHCGTEGALAAIVGHEIAHVVARHGNERMSQQLLSQAVLAGVDIGLGYSKMGPEAKGVTMVAISGASTYGVILPFSRKHESEADHLGAIYLAKAGYDPNEAIAFWRRFAQASSGSKPPEFLSTHPDDNRRANDLSQRLNEYLGHYHAAPQRYGAGDLIPAPYRG